MARLALGDLVIKTPVICPLCEREIPKQHIEAHHLVPKSKGGEVTAQPLTAAQTPLFLATQIPPPVGVNLTNF